MIIRNHHVLTKPLPDKPALCAGRTYLRVPLFASRIAAGFPSPADDYLDQPLDFNELLIAHPAATFAVRVTGDSMIGAGIFPGDIAIVDRALSASNGAVVLAILDGEFTIKFYHRSAGAVWLEAAKPGFKRIDITEHSEFEIWGVIRYAIRVL